MVKKSLPLGEVYRLLEPGPVVMVTSACRGKANAMTMSCGCVISDRNYSFGLIKESLECVINIPTIELLSIVVGVGNTSGRNTDKFKKFHLLQEEAALVKAPLLTECYANLECKVIDQHMAAKYDLFILEVIKAWIRPTRKKPKMFHHCGKGVFVEDGKVVRVPSKKK
jgi:flavin reductase (DIM6/NTAB) family NADH-FMN oxidoreductase RutF